MILPTKRLPEDNALIGIGADILRLLDERKTVSRLWHEFRLDRADRASATSYDWFVLSLDLLFMIGAISLERGQVRKATP
jgi:hypothetical protein